MLEPGDLYFDYNATAPLLPEVRAALHALLDAEPVNPSSGHAAGERSGRLLAQARHSIADLIGARADALVFTSGGTEANHLALFGSLSPPFRARHVVVTAIEHASLLEAAALLEGLGAAVTRVAPQHDGRVRAADLLAALRPETALVACMAANNETGVLQPVAELATELAARGIAFHVDAAQVAGRCPLDVGVLPATTVALTAHKLGGPPGVGALYVRPGHPLRPFQRGGRQERGRRGGTHNLLGIVGFGVAAEAARTTLPRSAAVAARRDQLERALTARVSEVVIQGSGVPRLPNTSSVTLRGRDAHELLVALSRRGLHVSAGSACQSGAPEPSHVLRAMGLPAADARATLRFSLGPTTTVDDIERAVALVAEMAGSRSPLAPRSSAAP